MGMMFGALEQPVHVEDMSVRKQIVYGFKQMGSKSYHMAKAFAVMGAVFAVSECMVEKVMLNAPLVVLLPLAVLVYVPGSFYSGLSANSFGNRNTCPTDASSPGQGQA